MKILIALALSAAPSLAAAQIAVPVSAPPASASPSARVGALLDDSAPRFDGPSSSALPDAPEPVAARPASKPKPTTLEKDLYWSTSMAYHAAFVADFATTGMVLGRGGYETDPLYTRFGSKNMKGVIGSAVALHAAASVASYGLYKEAQKKHGALRHVLMTAAVGINAVGIGSHVQGTAQNIGVLNNWKK